jgi:serine/threonine protein kinase
VAPGRRILNVAVSQPTTPSPGQLGDPPKPASAPRPPPSRVGTWLRGKYLLERELGSGGMAVVYSARHRNKKRFAVKVLYPELSRNPAVQTRFLREGYVANSVDHSGAVAVLDDDITEDGAAFLVMELLHGRTLEQLANDVGGMLPLEHVLLLTHRTLEVLIAAHEKDIVHRDIKPANVFLTRDGHIKVLDFGIARIREEGSAMTTQEGVSLGTPAFMAPEQALGVRELVDARSDLWALGATMFSLVTGRPVHQGDTAQHMLVLAATARPDSITVISPTVPAPAAALIDRALAFDKADRWPTARAMYDALCDVFYAIYGEPIGNRSLADLAKESIPPAPLNEGTTELTPAGLEETVEASSVRVEGSGPVSLGRTPMPAAPTPQPPPGQITEQPVSDVRPEHRSSRLLWVGAAGGAVVVLALVAGFSLWPRHVDPDLTKQHTSSVDGPQPPGLAPTAPAVAPDVPTAPAAMEPAPPLTASAPAAPAPSADPAKATGRPSVTHAQPPRTGGAPTKQPPTKPRNGSPTPESPSDFDRQ